MDAVEFVKAKKRMTKGCKISCSVCPLSIDKNGKNVVCSILEEAYLERVVEIVEKWSKEHPITTRQSELLKLFPDSYISKDGFLDLCPKYMDKGFECPEHGRCWYCRKEYWLGETEEGENKNA